MQKVIANRFEVVGLLGEGGVARVYRARDRQTGRTVAIKCLQDRYVTEGKIRRRFMREARAFRRLKHKNIVEMFDYGEDSEQRPYICLELVEGHTLAALKETEFDLQQLLAVVSGVLSGLAFAHAQGVYHRDVKPENIVVLENDGIWSAKLLDFGFARLEDDEGDQSKHDAFGTPLYMAPEQISHGAPIGPTSDIYSMGIVLYEFLTGAPPFTGSHGMAVALRHLTDKVPPFVPLARLEVPPALEAVVLRALEKSPADRYSTAADMLRAIGAACGQSLLCIGEEDTLSEDSARLALSATRIGDLAESESVEDSDDPSDTFDWSPTPEDITLSFWPKSSDMASQGLYGREAEREWLLRHAGNVAHGGQGRLLLLGGARGMGRRQLIAWLQERTKEEGRLRVLSLGHRRHAGREYGGLRGVLEELLGGVLLGETALAELEQQVERWKSELGDQTVGGGLTANALRKIIGFMFPNFRSGAVPITPNVSSEAYDSDVDCLIAELVALAGLRRPILLTVGGLDRTGIGVASFLIDLMRWVESCKIPILLVVSYPKDDDSDSVLRTLGALKRAAGKLAEARDLAPFEGEDMRALLQRLAPQDDAVAEAIAQRTDGNPYFAKELVHLLWQQGELEESAGKLTLASHARPKRWPENLADTILLRSALSLRKLPDGDFIADALKALAILGEAFDYEVAHGFLARAFAADDRVERAIETLIENQLLSEASSHQGDRLHFVHQLLQNGLLSGTEPAQASELHGVAADTLIARAGTAADDSLGIAHHLEQCGRHEEAAAYWQQAASVARQDGNHQRALEILQKASKLLGSSSGRAVDLLRAKIWLDLGSVELMLGGSDRPKVLAARIIQWGKTNNETGIEARGLLLLGDVLQSNRSHVDSIRAYDMAVVLFEKVRDLRGVGHALLGRGRCHQQLESWDEALQVFGRVAEIFGQLDDLAGQAQMYLSVGELCIRSKEFTPATRSLQKARSLFTNLGRMSDAANCSYLMAKMNAELGRVDIARISFESILELSLKDGIAMTCIAACNEGLARLNERIGEWDLARRYANTAAACFDNLGDPQAETRMRWLEGLANLRLSKPIEAWTALTNLETSVANYTGFHEIYARTLRCWAGCRAGHMHRVLREIQEILADEIGRSILDVDLAWAYGGLGVSLLDAGQTNRGALYIGRSIVIYQALGETKLAAKLQARLSNGETGPLPRG